MQDLEFHRRGRATACYIGAIFLTLLGIAFLILIGVEVSLPDKWADKSQSIIEWLIAAIPTLLSARKLWQLAKGYRHSFVRLDANGVIIHTTGGKHFEIPYAAIRTAKWQAAARERGLLVIDTADINYRFDSHACPQPKEIAQHITERITQNL